MCVQKKKIGFLIILVGVFLTVTGILLKAEKSAVPVFSESTQMAVSVFGGNTVRQILICESEGEEAYFFLPSYAQMSDCTFLYDDKACTLYLDGKKVKSGKRLNHLQEEKSYFLCFQNDAMEEYQKQITFLKSANIPALYLDTESGTLDNIHESKENKEAAFMEIIDASGQVRFQGDIESLKGHGNTTWGRADKKPYLIKLLEEKALLEMGSGKKWVLIANYFDRSYIRNSFTLGLAEAAGMPYTPKARYIDLYINNEYRGNYLLTEKIEIGTGRININNLKKENNKVNEKGYKDNNRFGEGDDIVKGIDDMNDPADITGGYLLERNYGKKYNDKVSGFITEEGEEFVVRSPSYASKEEIAYIMNVVQNIENAIFSSDGIDERTGLHYTELLDLNSFVQKYLLEEIVLNEANGATSSWFYKPENAISTKLFAGPAWDYDKAIANHSAYMNPRALSKLYCYRTPYHSTEWFYELYDKEEFAENVKKQYEQVFLPCLQRMLSETMDEYTDEIKSSVAMDSKRWTQDDMLEQEVERMKSWLNERIAFLNEVWLEGQEVCLVRYLDKNGSICELESVPVNETVKRMPDMENTDGTFLYWLDEESETVYDAEQPVTEDLTLCAVYEEE